MFHINEMLKSQVEIQEQTFQNISREIHDNIGQKLTLARLNLNTLSSTDPRVLLRVEETAQILGEVITDLSDISRSISSEVILSNGLIRAVEMEADRINKSGSLQVGTGITGEPIFLDAGKDISLFRIIQEAVNNVMKHAEATEVTIFFIYKPNSLTVSISDNGKGFDTSANHISGMGLRNMKKRAEFIGGKADISSQPQKGTIININIPIYEK